MTPRNRHRGLTATDYVLGAFMAGAFTYLVLLALDTVARIAR